MPVSTSHPTAESLIEAGMALAETRGLAAMTVDEIVARAGVAKGTFYVHFRQRAEFLVALHRRFHDELERAVLAATLDESPGVPRLRSGMLAYLDGCLGGRAIKALLLEARSESVIADEVRRRNERFAAIAEDGFRAIGTPDAPATARLFVAMGAEAALAELEAGGRDEAVRRAVLAFIGA